jgi:DNA-binding transcriptional MerR regulator
MPEQTKLEQLRSLLKQKRSSQFYAEKLGITRSEVQELLEELREKSQQAYEEADSAAYTAELENRIAELIEDKEEGTLEVKGASETEIKDLPTFLTEGKVDLSLWEVSRFWQMYRNGKWRFSVLLKRKDESSYSIQEALDKIQATFTAAIRPFQQPRSALWHSQPKALVVYDRQLSIR